MITIGDKTVGPGQATYVIGEIGINHNGCVETAKRIIDAAVVAGCDAVKFQKRTPALVLFGGGKEYDSIGNSDTRPDPCRLISQALIDCSAER